jgi:hypothetical protein
MFRVTPYGVVPQPRAGVRNTNTYPAIAGAEEDAVRSACCQSQHLYGMNTLSPMGEYYAQKCFF